MSSDEIPLGPVWPEGYGRVTLPKVDSTNEEALRRLPEMARPTWIMALEQTAARGRQGRHWAMPPGNFAATLAMRPAGPPAWAALRSFMAANALFETLSHYVRRPRLGLKWPNDVLLDGGKIAGILLETTSAGGEVDWLLIGIGVNLRSVPEDVRDAAFPPVALGEDAPSPADFLDRLAGYMHTQETILHRLGFDAIREKWLRDAARLGEIITARTGREEIIGRFEDVDENGQLVLTTADGERRLSAADVFF